MLFRLCFEKGVWLLVSGFIRGSSSSQNWRSKLDKIGFLVGFQKGRFGLRGTGKLAPGNRLLRLILRHFRHEIKWCFAVSAVFRKRCLAAGFWSRFGCVSKKVSGCWFLALLEAAAVKIGDQNWTKLAF